MIEFDNGNNNMPIYEKLLRSGDVAQILNISLSKAYQLIQAGEIPSIHIGSSVRVRPCDLIAFIQSRVSTGSDNF